MTEAEKKLLEEAKVYTARFDEAMDDDFNTADAIAAIFELVKFINTNTGRRILQSAFCPPFMSRSGSFPMCAA